MQLKKILTGAVLGAAAVTAAAFAVVYFDSDSIKADAGRSVEAAVTVTSETHTVTTPAMSAVSTNKAAATASVTTALSTSAPQETASSGKKTAEKTTAAPSSKKTAKKTTADTTSETSAEKAIKKTTTTVAAALEAEPDGTEQTTKKTTKKTTAATVKKTTKAAATTTPAPQEVLPEGMVKTTADSGRVIINYAQQKAMWVSLFELEELMKGRTESQFRYNFEQLCKNCSALGVNTLYVHARPLGDAFYESKLFAWSEYASGRVGRSPGFDPFKIITELAHSYDLSIHAWINPYRCGTPAEMKAMPDGYLIKQWYNDPDKYPEFIAYSEDYGKYWLNPGIASVRSLIAKGVKELVSGYDIDGIHIDDYFYPTNETWFDEATYNNYRSCGGSLSLADWRLSNCTQTVKDIYDTVKAENSALVFGIAPQGNYENNYNYMFADVSLWLSQPGYCDYLAPQIYFGYNNPYKPFASTLKQWASLPRDSSVQLVIGIAAANMELVSEFYDDVGIVARQIQDSFSYGAGAAIYRYDSLFAPAEGYGYRAAREAESITKVLK